MQKGRCCVAGLDTIIELLPRLTSHERAELAERLRVYASLDPNQGVLPLLPGKPQVDKDDAGLILDVIAQFLESEGLEFTHPTIMRRHTMYTSFTKKVPGIMKYVRQGAVNRAGCRQLLIIGVRLLYKEMTQTNVPTSSIRMMTYIHRMPTVINAAFPGYAVSGTLGRITR